MKKLLPANGWKSDEIVSLFQIPLMSSEQSTLLAMFYQQARFSEADCRSIKKLSQVILKDGSFLALNGQPATIEYRNKPNVDDREKYRKMGGRTDSACHFRHGDLDPIPV
jgi:hypothetical protein